MKNGLLTIPEDGTIAAMWGRVIRERAVLHEWPLSRVERISFDDGRTAILKTQLRVASTERAFYRAVWDPSILEPLADGEEDGCDWMLLPDLGEAHEDWSGLTDEAIRDRVRALSREFAAIRAMGPDLTTDQRYQLYAYGRTLQTSLVFDSPVLYHAV